MSARPAAAAPLAIVRAVTMSVAVAWAAALLAAPAGPARAADAPSGLAVLESLGHVNGVALACGETAASAQARALVLKFAPRTTEAGAAFERGTQAGYADALHGGKPCPGGPQLASDIAALGQQLEASVHGGAGG